MNTPNTSQSGINNLITDYAKALSEIQLQDNFWSVITIRESLLKKIYGIDSEIFNKAFFIERRNVTNSNTEKKNFYQLNDLCFADSDSFLVKEILENKLPTISDILPDLNKSFIILKIFNNDWKEWEEIKNLFGYSCVIQNSDLLSLNLNSLLQEILNNGDKNKIFSQIKNKEYLLKNVSEMIEKIAKDYIDKFGKEKKYSNYIARAFQYIFTMYELHLLLGYDIFIYYPVKLSEGCEVISILGLKFKNFDNNVSCFKTFFIKYLEILNFVILKSLYSAVINENRANALKSAVAAIMARNMSHHLRSHVFAYLRGEYMDDYNKKVDEFQTNFRDFFRKCGYEIDFLIEFLGERIELIAVITSFVPPFQTMNFKRDLFDKKINVDLQKDWKNKGGKNPILEYINKSDKIKGQPITRDRLVVKFRDYEYTPDEGIERNSDANTVARLNTALPGGVLGVQCFLIILEDIIRNTAKYGALSTNKQIEKLEFKIDAPDLDKKPKDIKDYDSSELIKVTITDNLGNANDALLRNINKILNEEIITLEGRLLRENLGYKEIKICAAFLRGYPPWRIKGNKVSDKEPPLVSAEKDEKGNLRHTLYLRKPKEILIIDKKAEDREDFRNCEDFKEKGIEFLSSDEIKWDNPLRHRFVLLNSNLKDKWGENCEKLPLRQLEMTAELKMELKTIKDPDEFINKVYENYIKAHWKRKCLPKIAVYFPTIENIIKEGKLPLFLDLNQIHIGSSDDFIVLYDHFGASTHYKSIEKKIGKEPLSVENITGKAPLKSKLLYLPLMKEKEAERFALELIEAGLTSICVIDERLYSFAKREVLMNNNEFSSYLHKGITPMDFGDRKLIKLEFKNGKITESKFELNSDIGEFDFITVHQGILDEMVKCSIGIDKILDWLSKKPKVLIIHSGRGKPEQIPKGISFLPYEVLESGFYEDKHTLVQILFSIKSGRYDE